VFGLDEKNVYCAEVPGPIYRLVLPTGQREDLKLGNVLIIRHMSLSADGKRLATAAWSFVAYSGDDIVVWDLAQKKRIFGLERGLCPVAITPGGDELAVGNRNGAVEVWNVQSGKKVAMIKGQQAVNCVAYAPNGKILASGEEGGTLSLWNRETRKVVRTLGVHKEDVQSLAWSHDGQWLAAGFIDGIVKIWRVSNGKEFASYRAHQPGMYEGFYDGVACLAFSNDDRKLATGGGKILTDREIGEVKLWDVSFLANSPKWPEQKNDTAGDSKEGMQEGLADPFELRLSAKQPYDSEHITIKVEVINKSESAIGWDSDFSTFLSWQVGIGPVAATQLSQIDSKVKQTPKSTSKARFIIIGKGEKLTREVTLTRPFKSFREEWTVAAPDGHATGWVGREVECHYVIPPNTHQVSIRLRYMCFSRTQVAFQKLFGFDADAVKLPPAILRSNKVTLTFK
jgi:WD40 repeat protein